MSITPDEIERLRGLCERATAGPWEMRPRNIGGGYSAAREVDCEIAGNVNKTYRTSTPVCKLHTGFTTYEGDKQFIAESRTALPLLLAEVERLRALDSKQLREDLAEYAHEAWSGWMIYLFSKSTTNADGTVTIPKWAVERWSRQAATNYVGLSEQEKQSDRIEADRMLEIARKALEGSK